MRIVIVTLAMLSFALAAQAAENWPEFRGPRGDGSSLAKNLPIEFGEKSHVKWKTPLPGKAWSSPVVWGDQVWLTNAFEDGKELFAICLNAKTGEEVKKLLVFKIEKPQFCISYNSYASCTPAVEDGRVYVHFGAHGTACIDSKTFKTLWTRQDLECDHYRGPASSPIIHGDLLIMHFDGYDYQYVIALNKHTGETVWRHDRAFDFGTENGDLKKGFCTPAVIEHNGQAQLICPAAVATESLDPQTGKLLWTVYHAGMNASARPIYGHGLVFLTNGMGTMVAVKPEGSGDITATNIVWRSTKQIPKKASLILHEDLLFMATDNGVISCVEAKTGEILWSKRLSAEYDASPLIADGKIYFFSKGGEVPVIEASRDYKLLAENKFDGSFMASPAVVDDALILRTTGAVYRIEK